MRGPVIRGFRIEFHQLIPLCVAVILVSISLAAYSQQSGSASLRGTVRDPQGNAVADATVELRSKDSSAATTVHTDSQGGYNIAAVRDGVYTLRVTKAGYAATEIQSVFLAPKETKALDLILGPEKASQPGIGTPQFFDQPQFTVSGVTDATSLGGHGSDVVVRTRESMAKETVSLGKDSLNPPANQTSLKQRAETLHRELAQHDDADLHHQLAEIAEQLGDSLEAVHQYQRAAEMDPRETYLFDWGAELLLHHAPGPAIAVFENGNRRFPQSVRMLIGLGAALFSRGNVDEATKRVCEASDLKPDDPAPYLFLGKMLQAHSGAPSSEVLARLQRFVARQPRNADAYYLYAIAMEKPGTQSDVNAAQAESLLNTAIRLRPRYALAYLQLGILHFEQGKSEVSISDYRKAAELDPQLEQAHYRLAQAYRLLGQRDKAAEELRIYEQLAKQSAENADRERREIRQFVYTLRDERSPSGP